MKLLPAQTSASLINAVHHADIFDLCERVARAGVRCDMVLLDPPYQVTPASWDVIIPIDEMWAVISRVVKPSGAIVLTATEPFTSMLVMSNLKMFRHGWVWNKQLAGNFLLAKSQPLKIHEDVRVFSKEPCDYYPQMRKGANRIKGGGHSNLWSLLKTATTSEDYYPVSILDYPNTDRVNTLHPTQKPVDLFRYLIRTYTRPGELVFDPVVGSGTTAVAAREEGRRYIVGDSSSEYVEVARHRLAQPYTPMFPAMLDTA